ncbi:MAG: DUF2909 domain-containing protein [Burkholderiaceae bacterium]|nr:DUF2909 domain-containing protein [Aquabacterium sp.]NUP85690.1 DUF2909 domain-containing protein [Burkholderiaceae bacterium]
MKTAIVATLLLIVAALGVAGARMLRHREGDDPRRMARALALRVGLSIALFLFILLAWRLGWIQPSGLPTGR